MKKIITLTFIALFLMGGAGFANAQGRGHDNGHHNHHDDDQGRGREDYNDNRNRQGDYSRPAAYRQPAHYEGRDNPGNHYGHREKYYREYVRRYHKHYRDYDRWYYAPKFYNRDEYVYFPAYNTYYDPYRRVYISRERDRWVPVATMPRLMVGVNLGNVQVQFMSRLPF